MINVIVPSYNCIDYIGRCLDSLHKQTYSLFRAVVIDDASTQPGYAELTKHLCDQYDFMYHRNDVNLKCPYNLKLGVELLDQYNLADDEVIFLLDGDDFLPENALERIADVYTDPSVWLTYGNYKPHPRNTGQTLAQEYPEDIRKRRNFRTAPSYFNHPITFRKFLWDQLEDKDLQTSTGKWFTGGYDRVIMAPFLEMACNNYRFINETLYYYNAMNPESDVKVNIERIHESDEVLTRKKKRKLVLK